MFDFFFCKHDDELRLSNVKKWGDVLCIGRRGLHRWLCWGNLNERNHLQDLDADGRIILKCTLKKLSGMVWTGLIFSDDRVK